MPDQNGARYYLVLGTDQQFGGRLAAYHEGMYANLTQDQAGAFNDRASSFRIAPYQELGSAQIPSGVRALYAPRNVDPYDWRDLQNNLDRIKITFFADANFGDEQLNQDGVLIAPNMPDGWNDRVSSFRFSVDPAPAWRIAVLKAQDTQQQQQQDQETIAKINSERARAAALANAAAGGSATTLPPPPTGGTGGTGAAGPAGGLEVYATVNGQGAYFDQAVNPQTGQVTTGAQFYLLGYDAGDEAMGFKLAAGTAAQLGAQKFPGQSPQTYGLPAWVATQTATGPRLLTAATMNSLFGTSWKR